MRYKKACTRQNPLNTPKFVYNNNAFFINKRVSDMNLLNLKLHYVLNTFSNLNPRLSNSHTQRSYLQQAQIQNLHEERSG